MCLRLQDLICRRCFTMDPLISRPCCNASLNYLSPGSFLSLRVLSLRIAASFVQRSSVVLLKFIALLHYDVYMLHDPASASGKCFNPANTNLNHAICDYAQWLNCESLTLSFSLPPPSLSLSLGIYPFHFLSFALLVMTLPSPLLPLHPAI